MLGEVTKYALSSRILVIGLQFLFNYFVPDHEADAFRSPLVKEESSRFHLGDRVVHAFLGGLNRWDSQYFNHIAQFGYTYEHLTAFFPFYPWMSRVIAASFEDMIGPVLHPSSWILLSAVLLSNICFVLSAIVLYHLTSITFPEERHLPLRVVKLYCFNPASIFFSSCYTESLFAFLTFSGLFLLEKDYDTICTIMFAASSLTRSNATLTPIFYMYKIYRRYKRGRYYFGLLIRMGLACVGNLLVQLYFWDLFCFPHQLPEPIPKVAVDYGRKMNYSLVGDKASAWCFYLVPFSYGYVQNKYWNVGFLQYWQLKQVPNFLLALPILSFVLNAAKNMRRRIPQYVLHVLVLTMICVFVANAQVTTRILLSASPVPMWAAAKSRHSSLVWAYFVIYFVQGIFLHANFFPWT